MYLWIWLFRGGGEGDRCIGAYLALSRGRAAGCSRAIGVSAYLAFFGVEGDRHIGVFGSLEGSGRRSAYRVLAAGRGGEA